MLVANDPFKHSQLAELDSDHEVEEDPFVPDNQFCQEPEADDKLIEALFEEITKGQPDEFLVGNNVHAISDKSLLDHACKKCQYKSLLLLACEIEELSLTKTLILARTGFNKEQLRVKFRDWLSQNSIVDSESKISDEFYELVSQLTWTDVKQLFSRSNLVKYEGHLRHLSGCESRLMKSKEDKEYTFSRWDFEKFLPLRISSYLIVFFRLFQKELRSPLETLTADELQEKILDQLLLDIEMLKIWEIQLALEKAYKEEVKLQELRKALAESIERLLKMDRERLFCSGWKGHAIYVHVVAANQMYQVSIFNASLELTKEQKFYKHIQTSNDEFGRTRLFPYVFSSPKQSTGFKLVDYLLNLILSVRKKPIEAVPLIYASDGVELLSAEQLESNKFSKSNMQTASNCVVANHNIQVHRILRSKKLFKWLLEEELAIIKPYLPRGGGDTFSSNSIDRQEELLRAEERRIESIYREGWELERAYQWEGALQKYKEAALRGHMHATGRLGFFLYFGMGSQVNVVEAITYLKKASETYPFAKFILGLAYVQGIGVEPNDKEAVVLFRQAIEMGEIYAKLHLASALNDGRGVDRDVNASQILYHGLAEVLERKEANGEILACYLLGLMYQNGMGIDKDVDKALKKYQKAADFGYLPAQTKIQLHHLDGILEKPVDFLDLKYDPYLIELEKIAQKGYWEAQFHLAIWIIKRRESFQNRNSSSSQMIPFTNAESKELAFKYLTASAKQGSAMAWYFLGVEILKGNSKDACKIYAAKCFHESKLRHYPGGIYELGCCHLNRFPGLEDYNKGFDLLREAAEMGWLQAMTELARLYREGTHCIQDLVQSNKYAEMASKKHPEGAFIYGWNQYTEKKFPEAFTLFKRAAEEGHVNALYMLAVCYFNGEGVQQNKEEAIVNLKLSSQKGKYHASRALAEYYAMTKDKNLCVRYLEISEKQYNELISNPGPIGEESDPVLLDDQRLQAEQFAGRMESGTYDHFYFPPPRIQARNAGLLPSFGHMTRFYYLDDPQNPHQMPSYLLKPHYRVSFVEITQINMHAHRDLVAPLDSDNPFLRKHIVE